MKTTYKKLKDINEQIAEFTSELAEIQKWPDGADKRQHIEKHDHFIGELLEAKLEYLSNHEFAIEKERQATQKLLYERTQRNQPV